MSLGRLTGLIASDLLLVQVLLMARIPAVERAVGQDRLAVWHRLDGVHVVHPHARPHRADHLGLCRGRARRGARTFWNLTTTYPGMLLALAGTLCLVMVVVTSVRAAGARLRYESWHLLHLYAYLGVGLALPHQLWTGQEFLASTAATVYWWTLWGAAAAAVLVWRIGLPLYRTLRHDLRVTSVVPESDEVVSVYLTGRALHRLPVTAGQFLNWRFLTGPGWTRAHPYSLSAAPDGRSLRITVKTLGDGSALVRSLPGTRALVRSLPRYPRDRRGPLRAAHRTTPHPAAGGVHRRRGRHGARHRREDHRRRRAPVSDRQRQGPPDQRLGAAGPHKGDDLGAERGHRHGQRRDRHLRGLRPVLAECARPGGSVTATLPAPRYVEHVMGMPISLALRGRHTDDTPALAAWTAALAELRQADRVFSTYRADSVISRLGRGEIALADCPPEVAEVLALGEGAERDSGGAFAVHRGGVLDPSGVVKGWAAERAAAHLAALPGTDFCLSAGGDSPVTPSTPPGRPGASASRTRTIRPGALLLSARTRTATPRT